MNSQNPPIKQYLPLGRCIYCDRSDGRLQDEHILALSMGGREKLPDASCKMCANITSDIELQISRRMFQGLRSKYDMPSRREYPATLPVHFSEPDGADSVIEVPRSEHPGYIVLLQLPRPGILTGQEPSRKFQGLPWMHIPDVEAHNALLSKHPQARIRFPGFHPATFSRFLAKTAYAFAVAELGLGSFQALVLGMILDKSYSYTTPQYLVGGDFGEQPERTPEPFLHQMSITTPLATGDRAYVVVDIRLFAELNGPRYRVVVGEQKGPVFELTATPSVAAGEWYWLLTCRQCRADFPALHDASRGKSDGLKSIVYPRVTCPTCGTRALYSSVEFKRGPVR